MGWDIWTGRDMLLLSLLAVGLQRDGKVPLLGKKAVVTGLQGMTLLPLWCQNATGATYVSQTFPDADMQTHKKSFTGITQCNFNN